MHRCQKKIIISSSSCRKVELTGSLRRLRPNPPVQIVLECVAGLEHVASVAGNKKQKTDFVLFNVCMHIKGKVNVWQTSRKLNTKHNKVKGNKSNCFYVACFRCCLQTKESTSTKFIYAVVLILTTLLMTSLLFPTLQQKLQTVFRDFNATW